MTVPRIIAKQPVQEINMGLNYGAGARPRCGHAGCDRPAVRVVARERHREFPGQTHDCCAVHSRQGCTCAYNQPNCSVHSAK